LVNAGRLFAAAGVVILSAVAVAGFSLAVYAAWLFHDLPDAGELADYRPPTATRVFAWDGELIGEFGTERRIIVPYDEIPPVVRNAFLAAEDKRFFVHQGVDVVGFSRAMARNGLNFVQGRRLEGGSTITQQVAKNVLLTSDATLGRKIREAILARRLEAALTKPQILELYLNEIWLGRRAFGVAAASFNYFGKPLNQLTLEEAAYLAALPKGPNNYNPTSPRRKANAIGRRNWVLTQMAELGMVTPEQAQAAMRTDLVLSEVPTRVRYRDADYFVEEVRRRALNELGGKLNEGGYYVRTTLDLDMQTAARVALMKGLEAYDRRHGWRGAWGSVNDLSTWEAEAAKKRPPSERRSWEAAVVESDDGVIRVKGGSAGRLLGEDLAWARKGAGLQPGDLIFVEPVEGSEGRYGLRQIPAVNGALVAVEPHTGRVLALVGGYSYSVSSFNRATQAKRQPGSAFKPFVYATAMENGYTPTSMVSNGFIRVGSYTPENYNKRFGGMNSLRNGLTYSYNAMTVRLAQRLGIKRVRDDAVRFGAIDTMHANLAMALGAGETTPLKLTGAYAAFANGGRRISPHLIEVVQDRDGKAVSDADDRDCRRCDSAYTGAESPRVPAMGKPVMDPVSAYQITSMLESVVQKGTATKALVLERPVAGKTGTTNEYRSAWFVGYTPQLVTGVFVGFDDNRSLGNGETGGDAALPIFVDFMAAAMKDKPKLAFEPPKIAKVVNVRGQQEAFKPGTGPSARSRRTQVARRGPVPYSSAWPEGRVTGGPSPSAAPPPPPREAPQDLSGLY
jgi:penicillin-binding protein 1A